MKTIIVKAVMFLVAMLPFAVSAQVEDRSLIQERITRAAESNDFGPLDELKEALIHDETAPKTWSNYWQAYDVCAAPWKSLRPLILWKKRSQRGYRPGDFMTPMAIWQSFSTSLIDQ